MPKKYIFPVILVIVAIFLLGLGTLGLNYYRNYERLRSVAGVSDKLTNNGQNIEPEPKVTPGKPDNISNSDSQSTTTTQNMLSTLTGNYRSQSAYLLGQDYKFETATMRIDDKASFILEAKGLDMSNSGIDLLKVNNKYPKANVTLEGVLRDKNNGTIDLKTFKMDVEFQVDNQQISDKERGRILGLLNLVGVNLPKASEKEPIYLNTIINKEANNIKINSTRNSPINIGFEGQVE